MNHTSVQVNTATKSELEAKNEDDHPFREKTTIMSLKSTAITKIKDTIECTSFSHVPYSFYYL